MFVLQIYAHCHPRGYFRVIIFFFPTLATPPVEPPIIEFEPYYNTSGNEAVSMLVNSRLVSPLIGTSLTVVFSNLPEGFSFNKGRVNGKGEAAFDSKDLANLTLIPPPNFSGSLNLTVTALAIRGERRANRSGVLFMYFQGLESQIPLLETKDHCLNVTEDQQKIPLTSLIVVSGDYDETLYQLRITQLPEDFKITLDTLTKTESSWFASQNSTITIPTKSIQFADVYTPRVDNDFEPVNCSVYLVRLPYGDVIASGKFVIGLCFTGIVISYN